MSLFNSMKGVDVPKTEAERNELAVTEHSTSYWNYHLSRRANLMRSLCGMATLPTAIPLSAWGAKADAGLPKAPSYCSKCAAIAWPQGEAATDTHAD